MDAIDYVEKVDSELKRLTDERPKAIALAIDAGPRGTASEIARRLGITRATVHTVAKYGRMLLAQEGKESTPT